MSDHSLIIKLGLDTADSKKRVSEINKELKNLDKQIKSIDTSTDDFEDNMSNMAKKIDLAKTSVTGLSEKLEEQNKQLEKAEKRLADARKELEEYKNGSDQSAKKMKELEQKVTSAQTAFNKMQREVGDTKRALDNANTSLSDMEKQFRQMPIDKFFKEFREEMEKLDTNTDSLSDNITNMSKKIDLTKNSVSFLTDYLERQNKALQESERHLNSVKSELNEYENSTDKTADGMKELERKLSSAQSEFNSFKQEISEAEERLESATKDMAKMSNELNKMEFDKLEGNLNKVSEGFGKISQLTAPLTAALGGLATAGVKGFIDMEGSLVKVKNMLNLTDEEADKLYESAKEIASKGFAEFDEVLNTLSNVKLTMGDLIDDTQLEDFSKGVLSIGQTFDADVNDVLKASSMLITNFGIDGGKALDIITYGFQNGLNYSDDFLDTLWEYSVQFADMGYSAEEFTSMLEVGMQNGIFNTDKLADAVKEANIRLKEMPEATGEAVETLGLDMTKIQKDIAKGGDVAQKAMTEVAKALMSIEDPIKRNQIGVEIFGTMWEDAGEAIGKALIGVEDNIAGLDGSVTEMNKNIEAMNDGGLANLKVKMMEAFQVIGEKLYPVFSDLIDTVVEGVTWFTNLDESTQGTIIKFGALVAVIAPVAGALSSLFTGLSSLTTMFGTLTTSAGAVSTAVGTAGASTGIVGSFGALASAVAPWLIGGVLVVGLIAGLVSLGQQYDETRQKALLLAEGYEGDTARMQQANNLLMQDFNTKFPEAKKSIETFSTEASLALADAFANAQEPTSINLDNYNILVSTKLQETLGIITQHETQMMTDLANFNTNYANQSILSWDVINTITQNKGAEMEKHVQVAYNNLLNVQKQSALIGQTITDEHGNAIVYTTDMYYQDLQVAQDNFEQESLKAQVGFYGDELFNTETFVRESGAITWTGYQEQLDDAEKQRDEMIKVAEEQRDEKLKVVQQLSDDELEKMGYTREELLRIAELQHEQYVQEAEGMYQDAVAEYTKMAEDSTTITDQQRKTTIKNAQDAKEGTVTAIEGLQSEIDTILDKSGKDFENFGDDAKEGTEKASKGAEQMQTRVVGALDKTEQNFENTAGVVSRKTGEMQDDIDSVEGKEEDVKVNFFSSGFQSVMSNLRSFVSTVIGAKNAGKSDSDIVAFNYGNNYTEDLYGLKDAGIKTISLAHLDDGISAYATKDSNASDSVSNAVANYNYNNSISTILEPIKDISITPDISSSKDIRDNGALINIENMTVRNDNDIKEIAKQLENYIRLHSKKW